MSLTSLGLGPINCVTLLAANSFGLSKLAFLEVLEIVFFLVMEMLTLVTELSFSVYGEELELFSNYLKRADAQTSQTP